MLCREARSLGLPVKRRRILYGWRVAAGYVLSRIPPDVPQLPRLQFDTIEGAEQDAELHKATIVWCGSAQLEAERLGLHAEDTADLRRL